MGTYLMPFNVMYHTSTYPPAFVLLLHIFEQRLTTPAVLSFIDQQANICQLVTVW